MTLCGTYSSSSIDEIVGAINQLHKNISHHDKIITGQDTSLV